MTRAGTAVWSGAVTLADYAAFLAWDQHKDTHPDGTETGPYSAWQVIGLVAVLGAIAIVAGRRAHPTAAAVSCAVVLTACVGVDWSTDADGDGLWGVGAALVAGGTLAGMTVVGRLARATTGSRGS